MARGIIGPGSPKKLVHETWPTTWEKFEFMTLRLRVVSEQRRSLGEHSSFVLGVAGATIGRSVDNDWVLPDPLRYVSAHHARIVCRGGQYFLEDVSTNGSFINDSDCPVGQTAHPLQNGDLLRLGQYHIVAALEADGGGVPASIETLHTVTRVSQTDLGEPFNLNELLVVADEPADPSDAHPVVGAQSILGDEPSDSSIGRRIARLAKAVSRYSGNGADAPAGANAQNGLEAFCRGAGIDPAQLPAEVQTRLLHLAGQLLREALVGLKDLDRVRGEMRNRFHISIATDPDDPRPSLTRLAVEDLMVALFNQHETRSTDAVQWLRETLSVAKEHENSVAQSMRRAFVEFLDRLDPAELEARFERAARRGKISSSDKAKYWDLYREFYRNLIEMPEDHLPHTFVEAFATAYRELSKK